MITGVEQNRVRSLRPNTIESEQFFPEFRCRPCEHPSQRPVITIIEKTDKRFQPLRFLPEIPRRPNQLLQLGLRRASNPLDRKNSLPAQVAERLLHVCPRRVLG